MLLKKITARVALAWAAGAAALIVIAVLAVGQVAAGLDPGNPKVTLGDIERQLSSRFPVPEVGVPQLAQELSAGDVVVFDVRTREEFDQSHIEGAVWVDPDMGAAAFAEAHGARVQGKRAVFYCAVGVRSAIMVQRVSQSLSLFQPKSVLNLKGGAFRWHAQRRPLISTVGQVRTVHPYDAAWGSLLERTLAAGESISR